MTFHIRGNTPPQNPPPLPRTPHRPSTSVVAQQSPGPEPDRRSTRAASAPLLKIRSAPDASHANRDRRPSAEVTPAQVNAPAHQPKAPSRSDRFFAQFEDGAHALQSKRKLCSKCREIPFTSCLPSSTTQRSVPSPAAAIHLTELKHILKMQASCPCCALLLRCVRKPENDLFSPDHIKKYLSTSPQLRDLTTFDEWVTKYSAIKRIMGGEEAWPFGYTADPGEAAQATREAGTLFGSAEERDLHASRLDELQSNSSLVAGGLADALDAATLGFDLVNLVDPGLAGKGGRALAGTRLMAHQMATLFRAQRSPLPCVFVVRAYRAREEKGAVVSVRVFAYGRGPRATLKEVCHFSLRFEVADSLRRAGRQIWYGRKLGPKVDVEFFRTCLVACEELHDDVCGKFKWGSQSRALRRHAAFAFRLVDVDRMCIVETDFEKIILPQWRCLYVTLSYTWGSSGEDHFMLTASNLRTLTNPGALGSCSLPATVRDAMDVVRRMGLKYLWVDRLCIPQRRGSQEEHPDNPANIANMGRIYGEAVFTIVAGSSQGRDHQGLWGMRPGRNVSGQIGSEIEPGVNLFLPSEMPQDLATWESRAWTFQEKLLSRRMLVFSGGFAVWHCRCAVWREDVNALDGDLTALTFPWPDFHPVHHPDNTTEQERFGLQESAYDESTRLFRGSAFHQYVQCVEDFSRREISDSRLVLNACEGIMRVLGSPNVLNTSFTCGLPTRFIDIALLWQPREKIHRRTPHTSPNQNTLPSWSWVGWEASPEIADRNGSFQTGKGSKGAGVTFSSPFDVRADDVGILMSLSALGEERIRPWAHILNNGLKGTAGQPKLLEIGLLGEPWMQSKSAQQKRMNGEALKDWEYNKVAMIRDLPSQQLTERHLVLFTQVTSLTIGDDCFRVRRLTSGRGKIYCRETLEKSNPLGSGMVVERQEDTGEKIVVLHEKWILDAETQDKVGTTSLSSDVLTKKNVKAVALSEAQYLGNETSVDVLGYPLYNVLLIEPKPGGIYERVGLGKIYKSAWKRAHPSQQTIVLG